MPDEDKNFGGALVLDFRKRWRHVKTIYTMMYKNGDSMRFFLGLVFIVV